MKLIEEQWGVKLKLDYAFAKNSKNRVFIVNKDFSKLDFSKLRINSVGMYFCDLEKGIRLSIEGSQIIGPEATKNVVEVNEEQAKKWMKGEDLEIEDKNNYSGFVIIKHESYFLGTGKFKDGRILNYVSKSRRVNAH
ncbi:hypothetical protein HYW19_00125 [Candidatus Woesearchaeota archaeon]|nr:hypothetical protein [Candidatus Woesearchaeota archaeon]